MLLGAGAELWLPLGAVEEELWLLLWELGLLQAAIPQVIAIARSNADIFLVVFFIKSLHFRSFFVGFSDGFILALFHGKWHGIFSGKDSIFLSF